MKIKTIDNNGNEVIQDISPFFEKKSTKGRPRKILSEEGIKLVSRMASYMCTEEEIAGCLEMSLDTLHNDDNKELFRSAIEKGKANGKESLRRKQYQVGMKGNSSMLIWLGKQWLGQTDKIEQSVGVSDGRQSLKDYMEATKNGLFRKQEAKKNREEVREDN
jgi:hypothetical protein